MASMLYINLFVMLAFVTCIFCSPIQQVSVLAGDSESDQQATGLYGTSLKQVVMTVLPLIPDMMETHEQQIQNLTTVVEKMATVVEKILQSQLTLLSERLPVPTLIPSTPAPPPRDPCQDITGPSDCQDIADAGCHQSGVYTITPQNGLSSIEVFCEFDSEHIGWIVFQRRFDGSVNFTQGWDDYQRGFGSANGDPEYWAGLSLINRLTQSGHWQLRIDLEAFDGDTAYAMYDSFSIGDDSSNYRLSVGTYSGTERIDSLKFNTNMPFSTTDRNNMQFNHITGGWWYQSAGYHTNLNGQYMGPTGDTCCSGTVWYRWKVFKSLKSTMMKMRRIN